MYSTYISIYMYVYMFLHIYIYTYMDILFEHANIGTHYNKTSNNKKLMIY